ncbi:MAG: hypothetical protein NC078_10120, partial [Ruminococcus sp.]|nr:hypothetical protein [Ruminococcus sp.]
MPELTGNSLCGKSLDDVTLTGFSLILNSPHISEAVNNAVFSPGETLSDSGLFHKLINKLDGEEYNANLWERLLFHIDPAAFDDRAFAYFYENSLCLCTLAHMPLADKYLKKLARTYDEAYITLAKRYYAEDKYSVSDFVILIPIGA